MTTYVLNTEGYSVEAKARSTTSVVENSWGWYGSLIIHIGEIEIHRYIDESGALRDRATYFNNEFQPRAMLDSSTETIVVTDTEYQTAMVYEKFIMARKRK